MRDARTLRAFVGVAEIAISRRYPRRVIADLPHWVDTKFLQSASGTLVLVAVLLVLVLLFVLRSVARKVITIAIIGVAVFGLVRYHETLRSCDDKGCACKLFGESVRSDKCPAADQAPVETKLP
jgi:hypothetical protein